MSRPRRVIKGATYLITRRCIFGTFFMRPDKTLNEIVSYIVAHAASKTGVVIHFVYFASNHLHILITDPNGTKPVFMRQLDSLIARAVNALRKRWGQFWERDSYSDVHLLTDEAIFDKLVYVATNPVKDLLVPYTYQWPGVMTQPKDIGQSKTYNKPKIFFTDHNLPAEVELTIVPPPLEASEDVEAFRKRLSEAIEARAADVRAEAKRQGKSFLGRRAILRQPFTAQPKTQLSKRSLKPRLAAQNPSVMAQAKQELAAFYRDYKEALMQFNQGLREVLFPEGTYWMVVQHGALIASPSG